jgi:hypothetical protein
VFEAATQWPIRGEVTRLQRATCFSSARSPFGAFEVRIYTSLILHWL